MTLRLPKELDDRLEIPVKKAKAVTKTELIRRAIDEFIHNHPELFEKQSFHNDADYHRDWLE